MTCLSWQRLNGLRARTSSEQHQQVAEESQSRLAKTNEQKRVLRQEEDSGESARCQRMRRERSRLTWAASLTHLAPLVRPQQHLVLLTLLVLIPHNDWSGVQSLATSTSPTTTTTTRDDVIPSTALKTSQQQRTIDRTREEELPATTLPPTTTDFSQTLSRQQQALMMEDREQYDHDPQQVLATGRQFKYHLNHLRPPSLVPITIQQVASALSAEAGLASSRLAWPQQQFVAPNNRNVDGLVQLQLPLQLHLKLKPLPLPMPPPPPGRRAEAEKRKRSLELQPVKAATPAPVDQQVSQRSARELELERRDLMAFTWREAERILLLSSMSPARLGSRLERRIAALSDGSRQVAAEPGNAPTTTAASVLIGASSSQPASWTSRFAGQASSSTQTPTTIPPTTVATAAASTTEPNKLGEVRRQRHSSQQQQGRQILQLEDNRAQALAASMLPFFWPSFQLSSGRRTWPPGSTVYSEPHASTQRASTEKMQLQKQQLTTTPSSTVLGSPMAASNFVPTIVSLDAQPSGKLSVTGTTLAPTATTRQSSNISPPATTAASATGTTTTTTTSTTTSTPRPSLPPLRKKHRKPGYLVQLVSSTPYPDSTRLASKYPMPKIKFLPRETTQTPMTTNRPQFSGEMSARQHLSLKSQLPEGKLQHVQVPKGLSKLIEQQLFANATNLMLLHRNQSFQQTNAMPPTTSVSKVVRLKNDADLQIELGTTSLPDFRRRPLGGSVTTTTTSTSSSTSVTVSHTTLSPTTTTSSKPRPLASKESTRKPAAEPTTTIIVSTTPTTTVSVVPTITTTTTSANVPRARTARDRKPASSSSAKQQRSLEDSLMVESQQDDMIGSNKVLPEEEDQSVRPDLMQAPSNATTERPPSVAGLKPRKYAGPQGALSANGASRNQNHLNIKLFHFKRKPDMNKLPFYKKPLNYAELGWTSKQIQEHLESLGLMAGEERPPGETGEAEERADLSLLKRKRRGKNQFERLMAELHGTGEEQSSAPATEREMDRSSNSGVEPLPVAQAGEERVPVIRKKVEPLVMKPMFFVMNQKRRSSSESSGGQQIAVTEQSPTSTPDSVDELPLNKSKPIIRMRRKHHGDQPLVQFRAPLELLQQHMSPWRPSKPMWSAQKVQSVASQTGGDQRLLLVPSSLLTPSGSHLVPLYAPALQRPPAQLSVDDQSRLVNDFFAWQPPRSQPEVAQFNPWQDSLAKPSGGLAPSGEESSLVAPSSSSSERLVLVAKSSDPPAIQPMQLQLTQAQQHSQTTVTMPSATPTTPATPPGQRTETPASELRVPKLLVKPMRPAKYSLNGYIPKPSLNQQQQQQQSQLSSPLLASQGNTGSQRSSNSRPKSTAASGRDLDSSTSNEIFSRRRGLQQQQRSSQAKPLSSLNSLLSASNNQQSSSSSSASSSPSAAQKQQVGDLSGATNQLTQPLPSNLSAKQKQMEESKRKYIVQQHQHLQKSPTLSVQKANQIKAKLGLLVTSGQNSQLLESSQTGDHQRQTSTNSIATAEPNAENQQSNGQSSQEVSKQPGAPLNSIPKTDFECTDSRGKFVAGLFADHKTGCQVWHLCSNNRKYSFLCPSGTIFNAKLRICDWRYNVKCENSLPF